jgi:hypothetical protein
MNGYHPLLAIMLIAVMPLIIGYLIGFVHGYYIGIRKNITIISHFHADKNGKANVQI